MNADRDLEKLYRDEGSRLWLALLAYCGDREIASDATSEAFAQALAHKGNLRSPNRWIWKVAFKVAAGELKDRGRRTGFVEGSYVLTEPSDLAAALLKLSEKQRAAIILHYYSDYPVKEVAAILGSTEATVSVHLTRGRRRLRKVLEEDDG